MLRIDRKQWICRECFTSGKNRRDMQMFLILLKMAANLLRQTGPGFKMFNQSWTGMVLESYA